MTKLLIDASLLDQVLSDLRDLCDDQREQFDEIAHPLKQKEIGPFGEDVALATAIRKVQILKGALYDVTRFACQYTSPENPIVANGWEALEKTK